MQLICLVWQKRNDKDLKSKTIKATTQYKELVSKFNKWRDVIDEVVLDIIDAVKTFESQ